jgi:hypothetical protein
MILPLPVYSSNSIICSIGPYLTNMCLAKVDFPLLDLMLIMCSLYTVIKCRPVSPIYTLRQLWQVSLCTQLCSYVLCESVH